MQLRQRGLPVVPGLLTVVGEARTEDGHVADAPRRAFRVAESTVAVAGTRSSARSMAWGSSLMVRTVGRSSMLSPLGLTM